MILSQIMVIGFSLNGVPEGFVMKWFMICLRNIADRAIANRTIADRPNIISQWSQHRRSQKFNVCWILSAHFCDMRSCDRCYRRSVNLEVFSLWVLLYCDAILCLTRESCAYWYYREMEAFPISFATRLWRYFPYRRLRLKIFKRPF